MRDGVERSKKQKEKKKKVNIRKKESDMKEESIGKPR